MNLRYSLDRANWVDGGNAYFTLSDLKPGDSGTQVFNLYNTGSLPGYLEASATVVNDPGDTPESELTPDNGELGASVLVDVYLDNTEISSGTLNGLASASPLAFGHTWS
ncbi:MAG: hypothetical protein ACUVTA_00705 [Thermodesulfitimonas sp.]